MVLGPNPREPQTVHHPVKPGTVTIAGKLSVDIPPETLKNALKQAGLKS
jgi:predicted RNA binding protein YcfA (HicA-like mRNA interferase family)